MGFNKVIRSSRHSTIFRESSHKEKALAIGKIKGDDSFKLHAFQGYHGEGQDSNENQLFLSSTSK